MIVEAAKAENAFRKVKHVREEYRRYSLGANMNVVSIEDLVATIASMYNLKIERKGVKFEAEYTRGMLLRYEGRAIIYVRHQLDEDLKRFTAVKELCHLFLDEKEDWSVDGVTTISDLQNDVRLSELAKNTSQSEVFAEIAAIELMYPFECRCGDLEKVTTDGFSSSKIALHHGMPTAMVERALSTRYHEFAQSLWAVIGMANAAE
jgi:Zn-dependent peptidase ImmA (M78 family)